MFYKDLLESFFIKNKFLTIFYLIVIMISFPIRSLLLPNLYSSMFENIRKNSKKLPKMNKDIIKNIKKFNTNGIIYIVIFVMLINILIFNLKDRIESELTPEYLSYIRKKLFSKTIENNSNNYEDIKTGEYITRILDISRNMRDTFNYTISSIIPNILGIIIIISYFFYTNKKLGSILIIGFIILVIILLISSKNLIMLSSKREGYYLKMSEKYNDSLSNLMNIYINNESNNEIEKNNQLDKLHTDTMKKQSKLSANISFLLYLFIFFIFITIIVVSYNLIRSKKMDTKTFMTLTFTLIYLINYLDNLADDIPWILSKMGIIHQSIPFFNKILNINENENNIDYDLNGIIEFNDVSFKYPNTDNYILQNFNLKLYPEKKYGIIGNSGSGKSSLMKLLIGIYKIDNGKITINNIDIQNINKNYLRKNIIYVNQRTNLFNESVLDNILYGNDHVDKKYVIDLLNKYDLNSTFSKLEYGINSNAGVNGTNLSLGMQKVVIILRGIIKKYNIIIFDEPLAGLDSKTRIKVMNLIKDYCDGKTVMIITHDKEIIPYCDEVININEIKGN
jgi:ABC-type multidrug transport system fused ATPase/permease subunit